MPDYTWSCLSCGNANAAGVAICAQCTCPAAASTRQIAAYRGAWQDAGGSVLAGAGKLPAAVDNDVPKEVLKVAVRMIGLLVAGATWQ